MNLLNKCSVIIIIFFTQVCISQDTDYSEIQLLIDKSRNRNIDIKERKEAIQNAYELVLNKSNDSSKSKYLHSISKTYLSLRDSINFKKTYKLGLSIAEKVNDSSSIANHYWNLGIYYIRNDQKDSAFFFYNSSKKIFEKITPNDINVGLLLNNMARIQKDMKNYTGSEVTTAKAIEIFKPLKDYNQLYNCYNNLGIIYNNLEGFDRAIEYHNLALDYSKKINKKSTKEAITLNNLGIVYRNLNNHEIAINKYQEALSHDSLFFKNPKLYATLTDNLAYSKFKLNDTTELPNLFYRALKIRDSLEIPVGIVINKIHLSEYYLSQKDTVKSFDFSSEAMDLAKKIKSYDHLLDVYKLLAKIKPKEDTYYLNSYIHLNDSLIKQDRLIRNKFTLIEFETEEVKTKNKRLSNQITWVVGISTALIFFGFLIYIINQQRTRNKELEMERQQQRANEEIYNLMIGQQDQIEEGRKREKERISLELHDGILGRLFGTRLSLGSLNAKDDTSSKKSREQYINELQSIEEEVRNISHELGADNFNSTTSYNTMIANLLEEQSKITNFKYQIEDDNRIVWTDIPGHIKINIYRIIQESIHNINKYAQAENVILDFKKNDEHIILTVKDDGVGFDQEKKSNGIGLKNMKSRVDLLYGQFIINSIPGKGTSISVDVPMTKNLT